MSITSRILLGFALISALGFYFLLDPILDRVERQYLEAAEEPMVDAANILAELFAPTLQEANPDFTRFRERFDAVGKRRFTARIYNQLKQQVELDVYITDHQGIVLFDSRHPERTGADYHDMRDVAMTLLGQYGARSTRLDEEDPLTSIMYVSAPILNEAGECIGVVSVYKPQRSMLRFIDETRDTLIRFGLYTTLAVLLAGFLLSRWVSAPLRKLTDYASAMARGERPVLPKLPGHQLKTLGRTIDSMRNALDGRRYVESYVQTLTHEMRSPVAGIRGAAELLQEPMPEEKRVRFLENIQSETRRLEQLSDRLLALSSVESRNALERQQAIPLAELVQRVLDEHEPLRATHGLRIERRLDPKVTVQGEPFLVEMAVGNLLQNAIDFSPEGGEVKVAVEETKEGAELSVEDDGPGIPDYARHRIFERFYSLPRPRSGKKSSGLGLCLVAQAMDLHGGSVRLENRVGGGTRAVLVFGR